MAFIISDIQISNGKTIKSIWVLVGLLFVLVAIAILPDYYFFTTKGLDFPVWRIMLSATIKYLPIVCLVPFLFPLKSYPKITISNGFYMVPLFFIIVLLGSASHLIFNEFLQSSVGFRPINRSFGMLINYAFGANFEDHFYLFLVLFILSYIYSRRRVSQNSRLGKWNVNSDQLLIKDGSRKIFIEIDSITLIEAADYYSKIISGDHSYLIRESMDSLEKRLPKNRFFRIHRSYIINKEEIREIVSHGNGKYQLILKTGKTVKVSRYRYKEIMANIYSQGV